MGEADGNGFEAAHGEAGDSVVVAVFGNIVGRFDLGHDLGKEGPGVQLRVVVDAGRVLPDVDGTMYEREVAVAQGHDDDHRLYFALGDEVIEDEVRAAVVEPPPGRVGPTMKEIENRVGLAGRVVPGWRVDVIVALVAR